MESPQDKERREHWDFIGKDAAARHVLWNQHLRPLWERWNAEHFGGRLKVPHVGYAAVSPTRLGACQRLTNYGAPVQLVMHEGMVVNPYPRWVVNPGGQGHRRAVEDLFLRLTVQQNVLEGMHADEGRYYGCGPLYHREVNRVGPSLGLRPVIFDRRGPEDAEEPICKGWPHNVRPEGYYGQDVTWLLMERLTHPAPSERRHRRPLPPGLGGWQYVLHMLSCRRHNELARAAGAYVDWHSARRASYPVLAKFEAGEEDADSTPIPALPQFDHAWLTANNGLVRHLAENIHHYRDYALLPMLADALQEAGCDDGHVLRHLNSRTKGHGPRCWVLRGLLAPAGGA